MLGLSVLWGALTVPLAAAQSTASLNGTVKDATGAVIANTTVKLTNVNTGVSQTAEANSTGAYSFVNVLPGRYTLEAAREGFRTDRQPEFTLEVNQTATVNFAMVVGSSSEVVNVMDQAIQLETSTSGARFGRRHQGSAGSAFEWAKFHRAASC